MTDHDAPIPAPRRSNPFRKRPQDTTEITLPDLDLDALLVGSDPRSDSPGPTPNATHASGSSGRRTNPAASSPPGEPDPTATAPASAPTTPTRHSAPTPAKVAPSGDRSSSTWRYQTDAWRLTRRLSSRQIDLVLRLRSGRVIPAAMRARITSLGLPDDVVDETLHTIHTLGDWPEAWVETAQRYLGEFRRHVSAGNQIDGARFQAMAALCYHIAQLMPDPADERTGPTCRAAAASLFNQALPYVHPNASRITIPWRTKMVPGILVVPTDAQPQSRTGLVVLLNGSSTSKEAMLTWAMPMVRSGLAILALDNPGTGEAARTVADPEQDDLLDGVFVTLANDPRIALDQVVVAGLGIGGNLAIRCAVSDRRIAAAIAITPPVTPTRWLGRTRSLFHHDLLAALGEPPDAQERLAAFDLDAIVEQVRCPILVVGAGRDVLAPPNEAQHLATMIGPLATLDWFPNAGHGVYDQIESCMADITQWVHAVLDASASEPVGPGGDRVQRSLTIATAARETLKSAPALVPEIWIDPDAEGARLLAEDEILDDDPDWYPTSEDAPPNR